MPSSFRPNWRSADTYGLDDKFVFLYTGTLGMKHHPEVLAAGDTRCAVLEEDAGVFSVPSKVLTYLWAARPLRLAVPRVNPAARIIHQQKAGLTVPPADMPAFLEAAEPLRANPHPAARCAGNGRASAEKIFTITGIAPEFKALCPDLS